jgi:phage-related protein
MELAGELVADFTGDTYRAVYSVRFGDAVYVLHAFKKKSKRGAKTPRSDIDLVKRRLAGVEHAHAERSRKERN